MLQLEDELSPLELPCLVNEEVMNKFCEDLHDQRGQRHNDDSSKNSTVIKPDSSRQNTMAEKTSRTSQTSRSTSRQSRTSTRTRAASLEKLQRTGNIKINQSIIIRI